MTVHVPQAMLAKVQSNKLSPVDIVMGDHWGEIVLGNPQRLSLLNYVFRQLQDARPKGGVPRIRRLPQSLVKVVKNGGTNSKASLKSQLNYLRQNGEVDIELSDLFFGAKLEEGELEALFDSWEVAGHTTGDYDKTYHIIVSFPPGTDKGAAYRASRAWASEMFASGNHGDVYDYVTAFHTDQAHPHMHVVVLRRGMEHGNWLSIHREGEFNYDVFRQTQVEVSLAEGIQLGASSRFERGLSARPLPDAEIRSADREGRKPLAPSHTPVTALRAVASLALYSSQMTADANLLRQKYPDLAQTMRDIGASVLQGQEIKADINQKPKISLEEAKQRSEYIMSRRSDLLAGIKEIDAEISALPAGKDRSQLEQDASKIKAQTAKVIPDAVELAGHSEPNREGFYNGVEAKDGVDREIKRDADEAVAKLADRIGIDPAKLISRYDRTEPAPVALSESWRKDELEDIQKNLTYREATPKNQAEQLAQTAYDDLHRNALQTYRKAERDLEAQALRRKELYRIAKLIREGRGLEGKAEDEFRNNVKQTLSAPELKELEAGQSKVFKHVTKDAEQQRALSRRYLEGELKEADRTRSIQLKTAIEQIDRLADLAAQRAAREAHKDRGLDR